MAKAPRYEPPEPQADDTPSTEAEEVTPAPEEAAEPEGPTQTSTEVHAPPS